MRGEALHSVGGCSFGQRTGVSNARKRSLILIVEFKRVAVGSALPLAE